MQTSESLITEGKSMKFEDCKEMIIDLSTLGGRELTIEELVSEVVSNRRRRFIHNLFSLNTGESNSLATFDAIGFKAATNDFTEHFHLNSENYEGTIWYEVVAGSDWKWRCKTVVEWHSALPLAFGVLSYHTDMVANENVKENRIHAMNGTLLKLKVITNNLKPLSKEEVLERDRRAC